jgi:hypothetical protein
LKPSGKIAPGAATLPWGIALDCGWARHTWGTTGDFFYYHPIQVMLRSVGPGPAPAPAGFTVSVDPRLVRAVRAGEIRLNGRTVRGTARLTRTHRDETVYETQWRTPRRLRPGDQLDVRLNADLISPAGPLAVIKHPVVAVSGLGGSPTRRDTGTASLSRQDSVYTG